jgi:hypothetical protein
MMPYTNAKTPLRDVLYAFSMTKPIPDAELLDQFIRRYPEYRAALIEFATDVAIDNLRGDDDALPENAATTVSPAVARAMSRLQNQLYAVRQIKARSAESKSLAVVENPFAKLDRDAFRNFSKRLHANTVFVGKLRDRVIIPETIPMGFKQRVADELNVPVDVVATHFAAQANMQSAQQRFKADQKPQVGAQQSFQEAVRSSSLTREQQQFLRSL